MKRWVEYIWLDHDNNYRSKTRILNDDGSAGPFSISKLPTWNFDGSSTQQADGESCSESLACFAGVSHVSFL